MSSKAKRVYYCSYLKKERQQYAARGIYLWSNGIQQVKVQMFCKIGEKEFSLMKWSEANGWIDFGVSQLLEEAFLTCMKSEAIDTLDWTVRWEKAKTSAMDFVHDFYGDVDEPENTDLFDDKEQLI